MITIYKDHSLLLAEAVINLLFIKIGDGDFEREINLRVGATTVGQQSAMMVVDNVDGRVAWVLQNRSSDEIRLLFGRRDDKSFDFVDSYLPNDKTEKVDIADTDHTEAVQAIYNFFISE